MSNVAKFLIVLNLILAGVFVGSAANYLGQKDYVQSDLEGQVSRLKTDLATAKTTANELDKRNRELSADNTKLSNDKQAADAKATQLASENATLNKLIVSQGQDLSQAVQGLNQLNGTLQTLQGQNQTLTSERDALKQSRDSEHEARVKAEAGLAAAQQQLSDETSAKKDAMAMVADTNRKNQDLAAQLEFWRTKFPNVDSGAAQPAIPPAKVLAADDRMDIVVISVGETSGVQRGFEYTVSRGSKFVAKIKITDVQADKATGMVVKGLKQMPVQAGDAVTNG